MNAPKMAHMDPQFYIDKIHERGYAVQIHSEPGEEVLVAVFSKSRLDGTGEYRNRLAQEKGADVETTLARVARRVLGDNIKGVAA